MPKGFNLIAITLPAVLPADAGALTALLLAQQQAHDVSHTKALDYINYLFEQFLLRRFVAAVKVQPTGKRGLADEAVALIGKLYRIEREHRVASAMFYSLIATAKANSPEP